MQELHFEVENKRRLETELDTLRTNEKLLKSKTERLNTALHKVLLHSYRIVQFRLTCIRMHERTHKVWHKVLGFMYHVLHPLCFIPSRCLTALQSAKSLFRSKNKRS